MKKFILITGGARSGKSNFAESIAKGTGKDVLYIATSVPFDSEMKMRVRKHREQRPGDWSLLEAYKDFDIHLSKTGSKREVYLLDCITLMVTNIIMEKESDWQNINESEVLGIEQDIKREIEKLIEFIEYSDGLFIAVTNEVGMGIVPENKLSRAFRDVAGRANQMLAKVADEVYLCVSGIPLKIK
jgi:adenosylcobinamide kinase/adenosylcobinamide-phosphate guanylyltransferase